MSTTYVYATTSLPAEAAVGLEMLGPDDLRGAKLERTRLPAKSTSLVRLVDVPRTLSEGLYCLNVMFALVQTTPPNLYIASLQMLLRGHGLGSMIWWRWRTTHAAVGSWVTDHDPHEVVVPLTGGMRYRLRIKGVKTIGYDDVHVELGTV